MAGEEEVSAFAVKLIALTKRCEPRTVPFLRGRKSRVLGMIAADPKTDPLNLLQTKG